MPTVVTTTAARWLTAQEQRTWRGLVPLLHGLPAALDRQLQADAGIPHAYYMILAMLSEAPDGELRYTPVCTVSLDSICCTFG